MSVALTVSQIPTQGLEYRILRKRLPRSENYRTYYGKDVDLARIENALRIAETGLMVPLTDLMSESMGLDLHLLGVCAKRFGSLTSLPWALDEASGPDVDAKEAKLMADTLRGKLLAVPHFADALYDLSWGAFDGRSAVENHYFMERGARFPWSVEGFGWVHPRRLSFTQARELVVIDTFDARGDFMAQGVPVESIRGKFITYKPRLFREYAEREGFGLHTMYWAFFKRFSWVMRMKLTELWGLPWRVLTQDKDMPAQADGWDEAKEEAEALGNETVAAFGRGVKFEAVTPGEHGGELMHTSTEDVNAEISKLVLGNTGTTEGSESNRANSIVQKGEQDIVLTRDGASLSESVQQGLVLPLGVLNFGRDSVINCPRFRIITDTPRDRQKDLEAGKMLLVDMKVPLAADEVYERAGFRKPEEGEQVILPPAEPAPPAIDPTTGLPSPGAPAPPGPKRGGDVDDEAARSGKLEDGGRGKAEENAEDDLALARVPLPGMAAHAVEISDNHGHDLVVRTLGEASLSIQAGATHGHMVALSAEHVAVLEAGGTVDVTSTPGGTDGHMHAVRLQGLSAPVPDAVDATRELLRAAGVELTRGAGEQLLAMPQATRDGVIATLMGHATRRDPRRPLDP